MKTNIQYRVRSSKIKIFPSLNQNFQRFQVSLNVDCSTRKDRDIYIYTYIPREMCTSWSQDIACRIGNRRRTSRRPAYQEAWTCRVDFSGRRSGSRPTFPLNRSNLTNLREKSRLFSPRFNIFQYYSFITRVNLSRKRKRKRKKDRRIFKNYLLDQICDESSATGWPSERERIHVRRHDEVTFVLVLRLASTDLHRVVGTTHPRINLPIPELLYFLPLTDQTRANPRWNGILFSFLLLLLNPSLLIATNRYPISLKIYILLLRKF